MANMFREVNGRRIALVNCPFCRGGLVVSARFQKTLAYCTFCRGTGLVAQALVCPNCGENAAWHDDKAFLKKPDVVTCGSSECAKKLQLKEAAKDFRPAHWGPGACRAGFGYSSYED